MEACHQQTLYFTFLKIRKQFSENAFPEAIIKSRAKERACNGRGSSWETLERDLICRGSSWEILERDFFFHFGHQWSWFFMGDLRERPHLSWFIMGDLGERLQFSFRTSDISLLAIAPTLVWGLCRHSRNCCDHSFYHLSSRPRCCPRAFTSTGIATAITASCASAIFLALAIPSAKNANIAKGGGNRTG